MKARRGVLVEQTLADELGTKAGGKVTLYGSEEFQVVGVFETDVSLEKNNVIMLLPEVQKLTCRPGLITGCTVRFRKDASSTRLAVRKSVARLKRTLPRSSTCRRQAPSQAALGVQRQAVAHCHRHGVGSSPLVACRHGRHLHAQHHDHVGLRTHPRDRHPAGDRLASLADHAA